MLLSSIVFEMETPDDTVWFEFVESKIFYKQVRDLGVEIMTMIQSDLVQNPKRGAIVKGTHGVRKARVADPTSTRGKSGSFRYLYLYLEDAGRIHLLYLFSKGEQANLSPDQMRSIGALSQEIRKER
jgi:hypothetical protein